MGLFISCKDSCHCGLRQMELSFVDIFKLCVKCGKNKDVVCRDFLH